MLRMTQRDEASPLLEMIRGLIGADLGTLTTELAANYPTHAMRGVSKSRAKPVVTPDDVLLLVADAYGVSIADLLGPGRHMRVTQPRFAAMSLLARTDLMGYTSHEIAAVFNRDHSTVINGIEVVYNDKLYRTPEYQSVLSLICITMRLDYDAIKNVIPPRRARGDRS